MSLLSPGQNKFLCPKIIYMIVTRDKESYDKYNNIVHNIHYYFMKKGTYETDEMTPEEVKEFKKEHKEMQE